MQWFTVAEEEEEEVEERALEATERTEELREHTEDTFRKEPVRWVLRNGRLDSSTDLNGRRGDLGLWDGGDSPEYLKIDYFKWRWGVHRSLVFFS